MRNFILFLTVIAAVATIGCTKRSPLIQPAEPAQIDQTAKPHEAVIVFFRSTSSGVNPVLIEADENENVRFITIMSRKTKHIHRTTPGRHLYFWTLPSFAMKDTKNYILEANLEAGKTYYTDVYASNDNSFIPVRDITDKSFINILASCRWMTNTPEGQIWFDDNSHSIKNKYTNARKRQVGSPPKVTFSSSDDKPNKKMEFDMIIKPEYGTNTPVQ